MRALLVTTGSRGDVEPFVALARGLADAGHTATLAAPARFAPLASTHGVEHLGLDDSLFELQDELATKGALAAVTGSAKAKPALRRFLLDVADLADVPADVVVHHPKTLAAPSLAERIGVPAVAAQLIPLFQPTSAFPAPVLSARIPRFLNRATWRLVSAIEAPWRKVLTEVHREHLGLRTPLIGLAERIARDGALNAWSPHLLPAPPEWPAHAQPLGFWRTPAGAATPPQALVDFLGAGDPPVYVGFGSMVVRDPAALGRTVRDGLRRAGRRGVVVTGAGAIELEGDDDVLVLEQAPHHWLLPRVTAAVHHGGVGTLAAALAAGVPQVIRPFMGDQTFWARRAAELGVAVPVRRLTADSLGAALGTAAGLADRAADLAEALALEDGVTAAVRRLEATVAGH